MHTSLIPCDAFASLTPLCAGHLVSAAMVGTEFARIDETGRLGDIWKFVPAFKVNDNDWILCSPLRA